MKMIRLFVLLAVVFSVGQTVAQSTVTTTPMRFNIVKEAVSPMLEIVPSSVTFVDSNHNGVIDANEVCYLRFLVKNSGKGNGEGCRTLVEATGATDGVVIKEVFLPTISKGQEIEVRVPIEANGQTKTGEIALKIKVTDPNGFETKDVQYRIGTRK